MPFFCLYTFSFYQYDAQFQNIPASEGNHLGFVWGPGDILVYDTIYKSSGVYYQIVTILACVNILVTLSSYLYNLCACQALWVHAPPSSMRLGKMRTSTLLFYANSLMNPTTSSSDCRPLERTCLTKTRKHSKILVLYVIEIT